jgi:hypothetical protein
MPSLQGATDERAVMSSIIGQMGDNYSANPADIPVHELEMLSCDMPRREPRGTQRASLA